MSFSGISQCVKQWKIELCTMQQWKHALIPAAFYRGFVCFSLNEAVPTNLQEKSISVKVDERRDNQL